MKRDGHENIGFFIGPEVEHTPAYSKKTLFVVGKQDLSKITDIAREHKATHIFMGANHSFEFDPTDDFQYWDSTIKALLERGFWVTLDYPAHQHEALLRILNQSIWQSRMFVPLLSVRIPKLQTSNNNLTIKFDDTDFKATNPGVWCLHYNQVTDSNRFTDWLEYGTDVVINDAPKAQMQDTMSAFMGSLTAKAQEVERRPLSKEDTVDVKNDETLGLDPEAKSKLKGEPEQILEKLDISALDAAEAYAGKEPTVKKGKK
jgi:hypothetical protein